MTTNPEFKPARKSLEDTRRFVEDIRLEPSLAGDLHEAARHFAAQSSSKLTKAEFFSSAIRLLAELGLVTMVDPASGEPEWLSEDQKKFARHGGGRPIWMKTVEHWQNIWKYTTFAFRGGRLECAPSSLPQSLRTAIERAKLRTSNQRMLPASASRYKRRDPLKDGRRFSDGVRLDPVVGWQLANRADALNLRFPGMPISRASFVRTALPILVRLGLVDLIDPRVFLPAWLSQSQREYAVRGGGRPIWMPTNVKRLCDIEFDCIDGEIVCTKPTAKRRLAPSFN